MLAIVETMIRLKLHNIIHYVFKIYDNNNDNICAVCMLGISEQSSSMGTVLLFFYNGNIITSHVNENCIYAIIL